MDILFISVSLSLGHLHVTSKYFIISGSKKTLELESVN